MTGPVRRPTAMARLGRFDLMAVAVGLGLLLVIGRLVQVQLVAGTEYRGIAEGNRIRVIERPAPRGRLLDAVGRVLAGTRPSHDVTLDWVGLSDLGEDGRRGVFLQLADELDHAGAPVDADRLEEVFLRARRQALEPVVVARDVGIEAWISISELGLPGIAVEAVPVRTYPNGSVAAHVIGLLGTVVDDEEAARLNRVDPGHGYRPGSPIGRSGMERLFERQLRGVPEIRRVEVDSANRIVRTIAVDQEVRAGRDVQLELDLDLQRLAERSLTDQVQELGRTGTDPPAAAMVVLDPSDGAVRALVSWPSFDPTVFVSGLDSDEADELFADPADPFLNRAVGGLYPPGSTFKPVTALAGLAAGLRPAESVWEDRGSYRLASCGPSGGDGCRFRNAGGVVLGPVDLAAALTLSSDTYFYSLGERLWLARDRIGDDALQQVALQLGLGAPTGIELGGEGGGAVPTPAGRRALHDRAPTAAPDPEWYTGDTVNLAIGQGGLLVTPIQLANLYAALGSGGVRYQPRLARRVVDGETGAEVIAFGQRPIDRAAIGGVSLRASLAEGAVSGPGSVDPGSVDPGDLASVVDGLVGATRRGTAAEAFTGFDLDRFPGAATTGTAEVRGRDDFALFAGFAPWPEPRYAFAVVIEEGGFGGDAAAPVVRRFLDGARLIEARQLEAQPNEVGP